MPDISIRAENIAGNQSLASVESETSDSQTDRGFYTGDKGDMGFLGGGNVPTPLEDSCRK